MRGIDRTSLVGMQFTGLPADYIETRNTQIEAVTLEDVNRVAAGNC